MEQPAKSDRLDSLLMLAEDFCYRGLEGMARVTYRIKWLRLSDLLLPTLVPRYLFPFRYKDSRVKR